MATMTLESAVRRAAPVPVELDGAVTQGGMTVITPVLAGHTAELRALLDAIDYDPVAGTDVESNPVIPFPRLNRVHFARWLIFDEAHDVRGRAVPPSLVFCTNYDEPLDDHLHELVEVAGPGLDRIYRHCEGYPAAGHAEPAAVVAYLRSRRVPVQTFYNGTYGRSVDQVRREAFLRQEIGTFLDERRNTLQHAEPATVRDAIQDFVRQRPDLSWALRPPQRLRAPWPGLHGFILAAVLVLALALVLLPLRLLLFALLAALALLGSWLLAIRVLEGREDDAAWTEKHRALAPELARREDRVVQNQLSSVINIKPGFIRSATLRTVLFAINFLARYVFFRGSLGSIPSIHFARWVIVDDGRRLAFFSNFDGSWESYLGEFVDRAANGLTAVWSNCVGFPRTRWLVREGAADEQAFKSYARDRQVVTNVWYSAYKTLSMLNITNNSEIRRGLTGRLSERQLAEWLRRL
jgi:hypothetical protein